MNSAPYRYAGSELDVFANANNWKSYLRRILQRFVVGNVLEVGAGIGSTTRALCSGQEPSWTCLEPDPILASRIEHLIQVCELPANCKVVAGSLKTTLRSSRFDTILYIDVLEHIEDDSEELKAASQRLAPRGHLIVVAPAHQWLYAPFDAAIGHYRRYDLRGLRTLAPDNLACAWAGYLDSAGVAASLVSKYLLRSEALSAQSVTLWDRLLVPLSRGLDRACGYRLGKTVAVIWSSPE